MLVGENFGEFGDLLRIRQSFICQLLVISEKAIEAGPKSAKVFFAKCNLVCNSPKFSPAKIFHYTVFRCHNNMRTTSQDQANLNQMVSNKLQYNDNFCQFIFLSIF